MIAESSRFSTPRESVWSKTAPKTKTKVDFVDGFDQTMFEHWILVTEIYSEREIIGFHPFRINFPGKN